LPIAFEFEIDRESQILSSCNYATAGLQTIAMKLH